MHSGTASVIGTPPTHSGQALRLHLSRASRAINSAQDDRTTMAGLQSSVRSGLIVVGRLGRGRGRLVVFEDSGDFAEEAFLLLRVGILRVLCVRRVWRRQHFGASSEEAGEESRDATALVAGL